MRIIRVCIRPLPNLARLTEKHSCVALRVLTAARGWAYVRAAMKQVSGNDAVIWGSILVVYGYISVALLGMLLR